ncbi:hypothetical protein IWX90DRAFT_104047 [Phyllosticta citrichinensis]|uniref:Uncharacterized protein n=1 Tax=Phyllosticta citrichinensis TaxID=1130410 RepID=A0ABR1Y259_9PEZI
MHSTICIQHQCFFLGTPNRQPLRSRYQRQDALPHVVRLQSTSGSRSGRVPVFQAAIRASATHQITRFGACVLRDMHLNRGFGSHAREICLDIWASRKATCVKRTWRILTAVFNLFEILHDVSHRPAEPQSRISCTTDFGLDFFNRRQQQENCMASNRMANFPTRQRSLEQASEEIGITCPDQPLQRAAFTRKSHPISIF